MRRLLGRLDVFTPGIAFAFTATIAALRHDATTARLAGIGSAVLTIYALYEGRPLWWRRAHSQAVLDATRQQLDAVLDEAGPDMAAQIARLFRTGQLTETIDGYSELLDEYIGKDDNR
jgi:hypothetical protein